MRLSVFARAQWAVGLAVLLAGISAVRYPGGTALDPSSVRYSLQQNFLSDLGMSVAYDGHPNRVGALCFALSLGILVLGSGGLLLGFLRFYSTEARPRRWAKAAGAIGFLVCASFIGVAVTPENRVMALHVRLTLFAWRLFPVLTLLLVLASRSSRVVSSHASIAWAALTVALFWYVLVLGLGPEVGTVHGLHVQVVAQKVIAAVAVTIFLSLSAEGNRLLTASMPHLIDHSHITYG